MTREINRKSVKFYTKIVFDFCSKVGIGYFKGVEEEEEKHDKLKYGQSFLTEKQFQLCCWSPAGREFKSRSIAAFTSPYVAMSAEMKKVLKSGYGIKRRRTKEKSAKIQNSLLFDFHGHIMNTEIQFFESIHQKL